MAADITRHNIKLALGGMRFDRSIEAGWEISPSSGLLARDIERMGLALTDYKEPLTRSIMTVMIPSFRKNFEKEGRPDKWEKLAAYTLHRKGAAGISNGDRILHWTGALKRGVTQFSLWHFNSTNTGMTIQGLPQDIWYGAVHQSGYGGMHVLISLARKRLGSKASDKSVKQMAMHMLDATLLSIEKDPSRARVGKGADIPQRQFILFQEDDIDDIQEVFYKWMVELTIRVGRFAG
jgi:phage gpG-like protein